MNFKCSKDSIFENVFEEFQTKVFNSTKAIEAQALMILSLFDSNLFLLVHFAR